MRWTHLVVTTLGLALANPVLAQCLITDFEPFPSNAPNGVIMFRQPSFSGSTTGFLDYPPTGTGPNLSQISTEQAHSGAQSLKVSWQFKANQTTPWVRLTTFTTPNLPNPTINDYGLTLSFWIYVPSGTPDLYVTLGTRETGTTAACGGMAARLTALSLSERPQPRVSMPPLVA